jgi:predicted esterase
MPFDIDGAHWGDDIVFDNDSVIDPDAGFKASTNTVFNDVICKVLIDKCGYRPREIHIFGFGQGGMLALTVAAQSRKDDEHGDTVSIGSVISIGGALPASTYLSAVGKKSRTPVLLCHGYRLSAIKEGHVDRLKDFFDFVETKEWRKTGDGMPASREEMMPIMQFWARRLQSRRGVPKGSVEVT